MSNILKMDLCRFRKGKILYIMLIAAVGMTVLSCVSFIITNILIKQMMEMNVGMEGNDLVNAMLLSIPSTFTGYMETFLAGNYTSLFVILFAVLFYGTEYSGGYIKNVSAKTRGIKGVLSKLIIIVLEAVIVYMVVTLVVVAVCAIIGIFDVNELGSLVKVFFTGILLNVAIASVVVVIFCLWQKLVPAIISGICYVLLGTALLSLLSMPIQLATGDTSFDFNKFLCLGNLLVYLKAGASGWDYLRMIAIAVVILAGSVVLAARLTKKKDIS